MGTKPSVEIQYRRTRDDDSPSCQERHRVSLSPKYQPALRLKYGKPQQSPSAQNRKIGSDCSFQASEALENCSFNDGTVIPLSFIRFLLSLLLRFYALPRELDG